jgi:hypothetical protein
MELILIMSGIAEKLGKNPIHKCQKTKTKNRIPLPRSCPNNKQPKFCNLLKQLILTNSFKFINNNLELLV